jgi:hypothetical protein
MALKNRMAKLEKTNSSGPRPIIVFYENEKAEGEEITEWEAENGPLFNREPMVIQIRRFACLPSLQGQPFITGGERHHLSLGDHRHGGKVERGDEGQHLLGLTKIY